MTRDERSRYIRAINVIDYKILNRAFENVPTVEQMDAIPVAVEALERRKKATGMALGRHIAVLSYHISHPSAILFRDRHTTDALTAGILAIRWLIGAEEAGSAGEA